jgi:hypothetical protein
MYFKFLTNKNSILLHDFTFISFTFFSLIQAPKGDVHSQQRFFCMAHGGEVTVDQAHRGFSTATDVAGYASPNPLFWKATPSDGHFVGQSGYGYLSIANFVKAVQRIRSGKASSLDFEDELATVAGTLQGTAILEAGRRSLDNKGANVNILYEKNPEEKGKPLQIVTAEYLHPIALQVSC